MRIHLIQKFGQVQEWLAERIWEMDDHQWRLFYDQVEQSETLPQSFEDTMPRNRHDFIMNPHSEPEEFRAAELAKWEQWKQIWGPAPWEVQPTIKCRPRMRKFSD